MVEPEHLRDRLNAVGGSLKPSDRVIAQMWVAWDDLEKQSRIYAQAKSWYQREKAKRVTELRAGGEKSAAAAELAAEAQDDIYRAHLGYRLAEQLVTVDREALRILHAQLDAIRTERADARAADAFLARDQT